VANSQVYKLSNKRALSDLETYLGEIKDKKNIRLRKTKGIRHY